MVDGGVNGGVIADPFVGRVTELSLLETELARADQGQAAFVVVEGEGGIGKTALLRRFLDERQRLPVLWASADESETGLQHGVVCQLRAGLGPAPSGTTWPVALDADSFAVGSNLVRELGLLQEQGTVVVVVDDLQWTDTASVRALQFAFRRFRRDRILVVLAGRVGASQTFGDSWSHFVAERARTLRMGGLGASELQLLARASASLDLSPAAGERLRVHTGGNPLHAQALLRELPASALLDGSQPLPAPRSYATTVIARVAKLSPPTQELLAAGAVLGNRFPSALAGRVSGISDIGGCLREAERAHLLVKATTHRAELAFAHPLVRAAIYDDLSLTHRQVLHIAAGRVLDGPGSLGHRVAAAEGPDAQLADDLAAEANRQLVRGNLTEAAHRLRWAAKLAPDRTTSDAHMLRGVELLLHAGDVAGARQWLDEVNACADSPGKRYTLGAIAASEGRIAEAAAEIQLVAERSGAGQAADLALFARAASSLALLHTTLGRGEDAVHWAGRALGAQPDGATSTMTARQARALGLVMGGRPAEAVASFGDLDATSPGQRTFFDAELLFTRGNVRALAGDVAGAVGDLVTVVEWSRAGTSLRNLDNVYGALAQAEYLAGAWDDGVVHAELAISLAKDLEHGWYRPYMHAVATCLHAGRGSWSLAAQHVDAARQVAAKGPIPAGPAYAFAAEASLGWARRDWDRVLRACSALEDEDGGSLLDGLTLQMARLWRVEALVGVGRPRDAAQALERVTEGAADGPTGELHRLGGLVALAEGRPRDAEARLAEGLHDDRSASSPLSHALLGVEYGRLLRLSGSRRSAIAPLRRAKGILTDLSARAFLPACDAELEACGVRSSRAAPDNPFGFTAKEVVVSGLVAKGLSNNEVAAELYVSSKAIEYHLGNIFAKVGITSRRQLAEALALVGPARD